MPHDPFATRRDGVINLGQVSSLALTRSAMMGDIFSDIGNWFEDAAEDIGQAFEDALDWIEGAFADLAKELANGPILHVAAGICAIIPGIGPGIAGAIEAGYVGLKVAVDAAGKAIDQIRPIVDEAREGLDQVAGAVKDATGIASKTWAEVERMTSAQAREFLAALEGRAKTDPVAAKISLAVKFQTASVQFVARHPELQQVKGGAVAVAANKALPMGLRVPAAALWLASLGVADPRQIGAWASGSLDLRSYQPRPLYPLQRGGLLTMIDKLGLPTKWSPSARAGGSTLAAGASALLPATQAAMKAAGASASAGYLGTTDLNIKDGTTFFFPTYIRKLASMIPERVIFQASVTSGVAVLDTREGKPYAFRVPLTWKGNQLAQMPSPASAVAAYYRTDRSLVQAAGQWFPRAPQAPRLVEYILINRAWPALPKTPGLVPSWLFGELEHMTGTSEVVEALQRTRVQVYALSRGAQQNLLAWLFANMATFDLAPLYWRTLWPAWAKLLVTQGAWSIHLTPGTPEYAAAFRASWAKWAKEQDALAAASEGAIYIEGDAVASADAANTPTPRIRAGLRVVWGELRAEDGQWMWLGDGLEVVISADGTADAGRWERA